MKVAVAAIVLIAAVVGQILADSEPETAQARAEQLKNLAETPAKPRFQVTDKAWPAKPGQAHLCLWANDKLAAFSFTVDDNWAPDHPWWVEQGEKYGLTVTWFVISERPGTGSFGGTWAGWRKLKAMGHDIQSHTITHLHPEKPGWKSVEWEYADSIKQIEKNMPGHRVLTLAYPGGKNSKLNSRELAIKHYIAARGTRGVINSANQVDYFNVNATGALHLGWNERATWSDVRNVLDKSRYRGKCYRGWAVHLSHKAGRENLVKIFAFLEKNKDAFWVGLFTDVAKYGQERDTATLKVTRTEDKEVRFTLTDRMDDALFDFPLTVKVRLADNWTAVAATQNGKPVEAKLVEHDGGKFALVKAVPDRGEVVLKPGKPKP